MTTDLDWFYRLHPRDQVGLLRDPHQDLHGDLANRLFVAQKAVAAQWLSNEGGAKVSLLPPAARKLYTVRLQLDQWWSALTEGERSYIVENRAGELAREYGDLVQRANRDPVADGPDAYLVVLLSDNKTGRFRLPTMIRVYVEMKAASAERPQ